MTPDAEAETKELMQSVASALEEVFPKLGFCLMIFEFNKSGQMNYISNADRRDVVEAMEEFIVKTKGTWDRDREDGTFGTGGKQ
jgi:hypothetical protein